MPNHPSQDSQTIGVFHHTPMRLYFTILLAYELNFSGIYSVTVAGFSDNPFECFEIFGPKYFTPGNHMLLTGTIKDRVLNFCGC